MHLISQFITFCAESRSVDVLLAELHNFTKFYGFEYYRITRRDPEAIDPTGKVLAERLPDGWLDFYRSRKYGMIDPVKRILALTHRPFRWNDVLIKSRQSPQRKRIAQLFQDAARYGLTDGYVFPIHGRGGLLGSVIIAGRGGSFTGSELALLDTAMRETFWKLLEFKGQAANLLQLPELPETVLTRRELDVINLLAQGMTSPDIGKDLGISSHTVDWYINGIQRKFEARNRQHVIALSFRYGVIS